MMLRTYLGRGKINGVFKNLIIFMIGLVISSCAGPQISGPYSLDEALGADLGMPLYVPDSNVSADYAGLEVLYYYADMTDEFRLETYFVERNSDGNMIRVASMTAWSMGDQIVGSSQITNRQILNPWSKTGTAEICNVDFDAERADRVSGAPYQSCAYWYDEQIDAYLIYSVWSEEKLEEFLNSIVKVEGDE